MGSIFYLYQWEGAVRKLIVLVVLVTSLVISGCTQNVDIDLDAEKVKVKTLLDQYIQATETGDIELFSQICAHDDDMVNFGTEASERIVGWDGLKELMEAQFAATENSKLIVKDQVIKVHCSGEVAWFSEIIDWEMMHQDQEVKMEGLRATGVLEKRNGEWVILQTHYSVPVVN
jgi:ketosteroid isomerase-like protein